MADTFKYLHTTTVAVPVTAAQMMNLLGIIGANNISMEMTDGQASGMTFSVRLGDRVTTYRMPVRWEPIYATMIKEMPSRPRTPRSVLLANISAQAKRTAWRLALDWLKVQCAYVQNGIRHPSEVFLADMVIVHEGVEMTLGQLCIAKGGLPLLGNA